MERIAMSQDERDKLEWLKRARDKVISQREAAEKIGVSDRWIRKLLKRMKRQGDGVVIHGLRGRASNRKIEAAIQEQAIEILKRPEGHDFGPTFASEQLAKSHRIEVSDETVRKWMIEAGLWKPGSRKLQEVHVLGGAGAGAAAGLAGVLLTRGPDVVLQKGSVVEMVLDRVL